MQGGDGRSDSFFHISGSLATIRGKRGEFSRVQLQHKSEGGRLYSGSKRVGRRSLEGSSITGSEETRVHFSELSVEGCEVETVVEGEEP
ncbi:hypothetical protein RIR_jg9509.t1 [Rhizophagus irregularis DAOM 181602=DAOM 197198]|nr:hypothetical protein RIR_jg9509.t1 [Rhizophagus irregularis DAOM 181602=DAOM 197198]